MGVETRAGLLDLRAGVVSGEVRGGLHGHAALCEQSDDVGSGQRQEVLGEAVRDLLRFAAADAGLKLSVGSTGAVTYIGR